MADEKDEWEDSEALKKDLKPDDDLEDFLVVEDDDDDDGLKAADDDDDAEGFTEEEKEEQEEQEATGSRYQKRINQLVRGKGDSDRRVAAVEQQNAELLQRLEAVEGANNSGSVQQFQETYARVKQGLQKAFEEGDTTKQVELTEKMADMRATARMAQAQQTQAPKQQASAPAEDSPAPLALDWWSKNKWFNTSDHAPETLAAREIDLDIENEGYDKNDPEYYQELDKRLQKRLPQLYKKKDPDKGSTRKRSPSATANRQKASSARSKDGRLVFSRAELETAKSLGLSTKEELTEYHKELQISRAES